MPADTSHVKPRKPRDDEIDVWGISHRGKVRPDNQDHFLLASIHKHLHVLQTTLNEQQRLPLADERVAFIAMVADGVGGGTAGEEASATALEIATQYLNSSVDCYYRSDAREEQFFEAVQAAARRAHEAVLARAEGRTEKGRSMATTLTLWMGVWPWHYLLQVGDSRYYIFRDGKLAQITRDQTMAQDLVDQGVLPVSAAKRSQFANVLSSAIGGPTTVPVVTRIPAHWNNIHLLCTDGLTKHVSDEQIANRLTHMTSAKQVCEQLLQDALDGGGTDNITVIVGRAVARDPA